VPVEVLTQRWAVDDKAENGTYGIIKIAWSAAMTVRQSRAARCPSIHILAARAPTAVTLTVWHGVRRGKNSVREHRAGIELLSDGEADDAINIALGG
jgi:hypothetical protein